MSGYGWLTESTLLPKKSKPIAIDDQSSLFGLKAVLSREKERIAAGEKRKMYEVKRPQVKNSGVQERAKRDEREITAGNKIHDGAKKLQVKQKIYESLESSGQNVGKLLVDFSAKALLEEDEDYEKVREQFYSGRLQEIQQQREEIGEADGVGERDTRERLAWEREVLGKLKGDVQQREKVQQVFDRRLMDEEKTALEEVKKEITEEGKRLEEVKQRREELQQQRIRKLQRLNILPIPSHQEVKHETDKDKGNPSNSTQLPKTDADKSEQLRSI